MKSVKERILCFTITILFIAGVTSCSSKILKYEKEEQLKTNTEFEQAVKIDTLKEVPPSAPTPTTAASPSAPVAPSTSVTPSTQPKTSKSSKIESKKKKQEVATPKVEAMAAPARAAHLPDLEDGTAFDGRRPLKDPFHVGESVVHDVSYYKVSAGEFEMKVNPYKLVNGQKAYSFGLGLKSSALFSKFYSVDDNVETLVDFQQLIPRTYSLHVKESGQLREARSLFNHETMTATFWEKKYTEKAGHEDKKQDWQILPYSQNVFSAIFYLRLFPWVVGKEFFFRIAHDQENILFKAKALRKEKLETKIGTFNTIVIKPEVSVKGIFKPMGDIYFWLSDDDRRHILRIELSIKIGTITSEVVRLVPGAP